MRAPKRHRPRLRAIAAPSTADLPTVARSCSYVGSPEHKRSQSFAGQPRPRADASICDIRLADKQSEVQRWLQESVRAGLVSEMLENGFPRYVWRREGATVFEARLVNSGSGEYKGYPLNPDEWPEGV